MSENSVQLPPLSVEDGWVVAWEDEALVVYLLVKSQI